MDIGRFTPSRIENARGNVTLPLESPTFVGDLNRQRCKGFVEPLGNPVLNTPLSTKFAYLPNCIIREIIAYTGAKYKKRNGKYMGQIPKNDPRFKLLSNIPKKQINIFVNDEYTYSSSKVMLLKNDRNDIYTIELQVIGIVYKNNQSKLASVNTPNFSSVPKSEATIAQREVSSWRLSSPLPIYTSHFIVDDGNNNRRQYSYYEKSIDEEKITKYLNKLWWISVGYLSISVIFMVRGRVINFYKNNT